MNAFAQIAEYEDARLGAYLASLDAHDHYQMAVEHEYQELTQIAQRLYRVIPPSSVEALDALLWTAAETIIDDRANAEDDGQ